MQRHQTLKKITWFLTLALVAISLSTACSDKEITIRTNSGSGPDSQNNPVEPPVNNGVVPEEDEGHGPDDDEVLIDPGLLNGSWRVATSDEDAPVVYFDIFHDENEPTFTGTFWMGNAVSDLLDGEVGDILSGSWQGNTLEIRWNPTTDEDEVYVVTTTARIDDDRLEGRFEATKAPIEFSITVDRRVYDNEPDEEE